MGASRAQWTAWATRTNYNYTTLDDLVTVIQGNQKPCWDYSVSRAFAYDIPGLLTGSCTPEAGTVNYYYTTSGGGLCSGDPAEVCRRADVRNVTATYTYDALNRLAWALGSTPDSLVPDDYGPSGWLLWIS